MTGQRKITSLVETCLNTFIGYAVALTTQLIVFPLFNIEITFNQHASMGLIFTFVSIVRGYCIRRLFNRLSK